MARESGNRRKKLIVNQPVQKRIVVGMSFVPIATLVGSAIVMFVLAGRVFDEAEVVEAALPSLDLLVITQFLCIVAAGAAVVTQALQYSHRVAGPMKRLMDSLQRIRGGDLGFRVKLRSGDELNEFADEMNRLMDWLREHPPEGVEVRGAARADDVAGESRGGSAEPEPVAAAVGAAEDSGQENPRE